jgi:DNA invertase Pin-like site-specific DNA recombinase
LTEAFQELLERAEGGDFDVLIVAKLDRLSRDFATAVFLEWLLRRQRVEVVSATEANGDGAHAEFVRGIYAQVAQLERAMIRDRLLAGKAERRKQGRRADGRPPFGYRSAGGILEPLPQLAPVVRGMFEQARDGSSAGKIARDLDANGVATPQGGTAGWTRRAVLLILRNVAYAGEAHGVKAAHPTIVSRRLFNQVQAVLAPGHARRSLPARSQWIVLPSCWLAAYSLPLLPSLAGGDHDVRDRPQVAGLAHEFGHAERRRYAVIADERDSTAIARLIGVEGTVRPPFDARNRTDRICRHLICLPGVMAP